MEFDLTPTMEYSSDQVILFFDGECKLCNFWVTFLARHDKKGTIHFAHIQSPRFREVATTKLSSPLPDSVLLFKNGRVFIRSKAIVQILKMLSPGWKMAAFLVQLVPTFLADRIYQFVARNRYRWFGKYDSCLLPTQDILDRFLE